MAEKAGVRPYQFYMKFGDDEFPQITEDIPNDEYSATDVMLEEARKRAGEILEQARMESEKICKQAFEEARLQGYETGYEQGRQEACDEHTARLCKDIARYEEEIVQTIEEVGMIKSRVIEELINDLKNISMTVAEKIIKTSLSSSEEIIKRMILSATDKLKKSQWAKIYISASDSTRMVSGDAALIRELGNLSNNIKIIAMDGEEEGTCIIELPDEIIDASVNTQLQNIRDILNNARL